MEFNDPSKTVQIVNRENLPVYGCLFLDVEDLELRTPIIVTVNQVSDSDEILDSSSISYMSDLKPCF
jgi:hypothetical protein